MLIDAAGRLSESLDLLTRLVDPRDAVLGPDGEPWLPVGSFQSPRPSSIWQAYRSESELWHLISESRWLSLNNEFAANALENRISYIVGWGHTYSVARRPGVSGQVVPGALLEVVQSWLDGWVQANKWYRRQQEIILRRDRDGEVLLRQFRRPGGLLEVRFIEPEHLKNPGISHPHTHYGITFDSDDAETPETFHVWSDQRGTDIQHISAEEVQHRKQNVDCSAPRGLPTLYPVRKNLARAARLLRNITLTSEIQTAIALIRKHGGTKTAVQSFVTSQSDQVAHQTSVGGFQTRNFRRYPPGSILDASAGTEYEFPAQGLDVQKYVAGLEAELRAIASRLVMPEFMLAANAANANYASTLVSEGPFVKLIERLQQDNIDWDLELIHEALGFAAAAGIDGLPQDVLELVEVKAEPPQIVSRDRKDEVLADQVLLNAGVMSRQTMAQRAGLEWDEERERIADESEAFGEFSENPD